MTDSWKLINVDIIKFKGIYPKGVSGCDVSPTSSEEIDRFIETALYYKDNSIEAVVFPKDDFDLSGFESIDNSISIMLPKTSERVLCWINAKSIRYKFTDRITDDLCKKHVNKYLFLSPPDQEIPPWSHGYNTYSSPEKSTVILPELPPERSYDERLNFVTQISSDHYEIKEEIEYVLQRYNGIEKDLKEKLSKIKEYVLRRDNGIEKDLKEKLSKIKEGDVLDLTPAEFYAIKQLPPRMDGWWNF